MNSWIQEYAMTDTKGPVFGKGDSVEEYRRQRWVAEYSVDKAHEYRLSCFVVYYNWVHNCAKIREWLLKLLLKTYEIDRECRDTDWDVAYRRVTYVNGD